MDQSQGLGTKDEFDINTKYMTDLYHRMIDSCSAKCVAANGYHEEDLNKGETVCINRCVKKFLEVHKFVQEKMQDNQAQQAAMGNQ